MWRFGRIVLVRQKTVGVRQVKTKGNLSEQLLMSAVELALVCDPIHQCKENAR